MISLVRTLPPVDARRQRAAQGVDRRAQRRCAGGQNSQRARLDRERRQLADVPARREPQRPVRVRGNRPCMPYSGGHLGCS